MTPSPSQVERVLALLRERAGAGRGVNTTELQELPVADGGRPILRLAARVHQLRERGFVISGRRERNGTQTYVLLAEPGVETSHHRAAPLTDGGYARESTGRGPRLTESSSGAGGRTECISGNPAVHSHATEIPGVGHAGEGREPLESDQAPGHSGGGQRLRDTSRLTSATARTGTGTAPAPAPAEPLAALFDTSGLHQPLGFAESEAAA